VADLLAELAAGHSPEPVLVRELLAQAAEMGFALQGVQQLKELVAASAAWEAAARGVLAQPPAPEQVRACRARCRQLPAGPAASPRRGAPAAADARASPAFCCAQIATLQALVEQGSEARLAYPELAQLRARVGALEWEAQVGCRGGCRAAGLHCCWAALLLSCCWAALLLSCWAPAADAGAHAPPLAEEAAGCRVERLTGCRPAVRAGAPAVPRGHPPAQRASGGGRAGAAAGAAGGRREA
jgi:hypothetical protein